MKQWTDIATAVLIALALITYIGAKAHFFLRYGVPSYLTEHWLFWLAMACIAAVAKLIEWLGQSRED